MKIRFFALLPMIVIGAARAQPIQATGPLPGYVCMSLNVAPGEMLDKSKAVLLRAAPDSSAAIVGRATSVLIVQASAVPTNGFLEIIRPNRQTAWIEAAYARPWSNPYAPTARCVPSIMTNGSIGTASH